MNQVTRTLVTAAVVGLAAGGLGLYAWLGVAEPDRRAAEEEERDARLFPLPAVDDGGTVSLEVVKLAVTAGGDTTVIERSPGEPWRMTAPVSAGVEPVAVGDIVDTVLTGRFVAALDEAPGADTLSRYGLDPPRFTVTAEVLVGGVRREVTLTGGTENSFNSTVYVRRGDSARVHAAERAVARALARSTFDLRDKALLLFDLDELDGISFRSADRQWVLERADAGAWAITRPPLGPADELAITSLVATQGLEQAVAFPALTAESLAGFERPAVEMTLSARDGGSTRLRFVRTRPDAGQTWLLLREDVEGAVLAEMPASAIHLDRPPGSLVDRRVLHFEADLVSQLELADADGGRLLLVREVLDGGATQWSSEDPDAGSSVRQAAADAALSALLALRAEEGASGRPRLHGPRRTVRAMASDGGQLASLVIGSPRAGRPDRVVVQAAPATPAEVDADALTALTVSWDELVAPPGL